MNIYGFEYGRENNNNRYMYPKIVKYADRVILVKDQIIENN